MTTVRDHRRRADIQVPRGTYARTQQHRARAADADRDPQRAAARGGPGSWSGSGSGSGSGTVPTGGPGPVVRDHRRTPAATPTWARSRVTAGRLRDGLGDGGGPELTAAAPPSGPPSTPSPGSRPGSAR